MLCLTENWARKSILCNDYSCHVWLRLPDSYKTAFRFDLLRRQQEQPVQIFSTWTKSLSSHSCGCSYNMELCNVNIGMEWQWSLCTISICIISYSFLRHINPTSFQQNNSSCMSAYVSLCIISCTSVSDTHDQLPQQNSKPFAATHKSKEVLS